jgi:ABC-2 type transport system ATP-binding protein
VAEAAYCDYVGVMSDGQLLMVETPEKLKRIGIGGEIIELYFENPISISQMENLRKQPDVSAGQIQLLDNEKLRVIVEDAAESTPTLLRWCQDHQITVKEAQKLEPSFDDVFVQIINRHRKNA